MKLISGDAMFLGTVIFTRVYLFRDYSIRNTGILTLQIIDQYLYHMLIQDIDIMLLTIVLNSIDYHCKKEFSNPFPRSHLLTACGVTPNCLIRSFN